MSDKNKKGSIEGMLILGSFCGLVEVVLSALLHRAGIHFSALLIGLDSLFIGMAMAVYGNPLTIIGMGVIACLYKQLVVPVLGLSVLCKANACLAVLLEFSGLAGATALFSKGLNKGPGSRFLTSASGVFLGSVAYYFLGMHAQPCNYMLSFNVSAGLASFTLKEGLVWALFSGLFFVLGWALGEKVKARALDGRLQNPRLFHAGVGLTVFACLLISVASIYFNRG